MQLGSIDIFNGLVCPPGSLQPHRRSRPPALVLPGVGSFDAGMGCLEQRDVIDVLKRRVIEDRVPVLGICLGAQLMTTGSEEGDYLVRASFGRRCQDFVSKMLPERFPISAGIGRCPE